MKPLYHSPSLYVDGNWKGDLRRSTSVKHTDALFIKEISIILLLEAQVTSLMEDIKQKLYRTITCFAKDGMNFLTNSCIKLYTE